MRVELHEGEWPVDRRGCPELRQRDGVVAVEDYKDDAYTVDGFEALA